MVWLNIEADLKAKDCMDTMRNALIHHHVAFNSFSIQLEGKCIVKILKKAVEACNRPVAKQYWAKKFGEDSTEISDLGMEALEWAMDEATPAH